MPVFVKYKGKLTFADEKLAKRVFDFLSLTEGTVFWVFPKWRDDEKMYGAKLEGKTLKIDYDGDCGYSEYYTSLAAVKNVIGLAKSGKVVFGTVEYEDEGRVHYRLEASDELRRQILGSNDET